MPHVRTFLDHAELALQPHVALVDINARDNWTLRLYRTGRVNSFGRDLSGINPIEVYAPDTRPLLQDNVMKLLAHLCGWKLTRLIITVKGMTNQGSGVKPPLAADDDKPDCIVNFMAFGKPFAHNNKQALLKPSPPGNGWISTQAFPKLDAGFVIFSSHRGLLFRFTRPFILPRNPGY